MPSRAQQMVTDIMSSASLRSPAKQIFDYGASLSEANLVELTCTFDDDSVLRFIEQPDLSGHHRQVTGTYSDTQNHWYHFTIILDDQEVT